MRKTLLAAIVVVLIAVIAGGYLAYSYLSSQNQPSNTPTASLSVEQIRDQAMVYIAANHTQTLPLMQTLHWSGGRQDTGVVGSETYQYTGADWEMMIQYPVVPNPTYTINVNYTAGGGFTWAGTCINGVIAQTSSTLADNTTLTQEQIRDLTLQYLNAYHNQTSQYMHDLSWTGGRMNMGMMVGSETYSYQSTGWNVTMQYPVVPNPIYTITAQYMPMGMHSAIMTWDGTLQSGRIAETSYTYNP